MTTENKSRNEKIVELWNTTQLSQEDIAAKLEAEGYTGCTRQIVGGVIARVRTKCPEKITRAVQNKPGVKPWKFHRPKAAGIQGAIAAKKKLVAEGKKPPSVDPALSLAMGEAVGALRENQCRYPLELDEPAFAYCSEARRDDETCYCATHHAIVYRGFSEPRRRNMWRRRYGRR